MTLQVKHGSITVKIYRRQFRGKSRFEVRGHFGGKPQRKYFTEKKRAILHAERLAASIANGHTAVLTITPPEASDFHEQKKEAAIEGRSQREIFYLGLTTLRGQKSVLQSPIIADVVREFIAVKEQANLSEYYIGDFKLRLNRFAADFKVPVTDVRASELLAWLNGLKKIIRSRKGRRDAGPIGPRTWNNYRSALAALFAFAQEKKYLPAEWAELKHINPVRIRNRKILIFTPAELRTMLEACPDRLLPAVVISAFAGLRSEEVDRLEWKDINWEKGFIFCRHHITKTDRPRMVPLFDNLREWLQPWREAHGPVSSYKNAKTLGQAKAKLAKRVGLTWQRNGLRHSYISYRVAATGDAAAVSLEAGNSVQDIHRNYLELVTPAEAEKWFGIRRKTVAQNVLPLIFATPAIK